MPYLYVTWLLHVVRDVQRWWLLWKRMMVLKSNGPRDLFRYAVQKRVLPLMRRKAFFLTPFGQSLR